MMKRNQRRTPPLFTLFSRWMMGLTAKNKKHKPASWRNYGMNPQLQALVTVMAALLLAGVLFSGALLLEYTNHADLLDKGKQLMKEGKVAWAADNFRKIIQQDAAHYEAHLRLGQVLLELGELEQAEHEFETAMAIKLNIPPQSRTAQQDALVSIASAKLSMIKKHWQEAEKTLMLAYEHQSNNLELKEALWVLYQQWGQDAFEQKHLDEAIIQWGHALDFVGRYKQEEETQAWLAKGLQQSYQVLEDRKASPKERLAFIDSALRKYYSYKLLLAKATIYEHEVKDAAQALAAYRQAYQAQPQVVGLKLLEQLDGAMAQAQLAGQTRLSHQLEAEAARVKRLLKQHQSAGTLISVGIQSVQRTAEDAQTTEWEPKVVLVLRNQSGVRVPYLKLKMVLSSNNQLLCSFTQEVFPPLQAGEVRQLVLLPKQRYLMHKLHEGTLQAEVLFTLDEEDPVTWVSKDKKTVTLFPPAQWLNQWFPWELHKKQPAKKKPEESPASSLPVSIGSVPNA
ncbi:MAG: tetratricopeptide repeat protein [Candidatus Melainabacteria bacterium]|nr:tetratricopeptide repeat protein [Candidatus Melainabacteria bacterium]